jgi:hypothetical protein
MSALGRPTTTPPSVHSTRFLLPGKSLRWKTDSTTQSAELAKSKNMYKEMESVMGEKSMKSAVTNTTGSSTASASASQAQAQAQASKEQARQRQRKQAMINAGVSFFMVLLAGQVFKVSTQKRKKDIQVEVLEEILADKRALLRSLGTDETLVPVANQCAKEILQLTSTKDKSQKSTWWGGSISSSNHQDGDETEIAELILVTLRAEMQRRIGHEGMSEAEKDKSALKELQPDAAEDFLLSVLSDDKLLQELENLQVEQEANGATVVKTRVFSI